VHPTPAVLSGAAPTKAELDKAKKAAEKVEKETTDASGLASNLKGQAETKKQEITSAAITLLVGVEFDAITPDLE
jgi:multidrug efflux pump subunit AcrB